MKKIVATFLLLTVLVASVLSVNAAGISDTEKGILDALKAEIQFKSDTVKIPAQYINQAENYLNSNDISDADVERIIAKINEVKEVTKNVDANTIAGIPAKVKTEILDIAAEASGIVGATLTLKSNSDIIITDNSGETIFEANINKNTPIKQTDVSMTGTVLISVALLCGVSFIIFAARKTVKSR